MNLLHHLVLHATQGSAGIFGLFSKPAQLQRVFSEFGGDQFTHVAGVLCIPGVRVVLLGNDAVLLDKICNLAEYK